MSAEAQQTLFHQLAPIPITQHGKVTIVGVGQVGMACAYSILQQVRYANVNLPGLLLEHRE